MRAHAWYLSIVRYQGAIVCGLDVCFYDIDSVQIAGSHGLISNKQAKETMSSTRNSISVIFAICALVAGGLAQEIRTDYDRKADFSQYKTFSFDKIETKDTLWVDRITAAVGSALTARGLKRVKTGGDIAVIAIGMTADRQTLNTFYDSFGGGWGWRRWGGDDFGESTTSTETYRIGTLVVDLFDRKTKTLLWRGSASRTLSNSSAKNIRTFRKSVDKLFKDFPPRA